MEAISVKNIDEFPRLWALFSSLILKISQAQSSLGHPINATVVLDAMDECNGSKPLVRALRKLVHAASGAIRVVVTARKSGDHVGEFTRTSTDLPLPLSLEITPDDIRHDISSFTQYKVKRMERLRGDDRENLRKRIIAELTKVENHQGMFLWVYLMCKDIKRQLDVPAILKLLPNLPKGLDAMYLRICQCLAEKDQQSRDFCQIILQWIVVSNRPLLFAELEQALKVMQAQGDHSRTKDFFDADGYGERLLWSRKDIVEACGNLVRYTGLNDGDMIGLVHLSARQFLRGDTTQSHPPPSPDRTSFIVDVPQAKSTMAISCIDYLLNDTTLHSDPYFTQSGPLGSETPSKSKIDLRHSLMKRYPLFDYAVVYWPGYMLDALNAIPNTANARRLLQKVALFVGHPFSLTWLEDYIRRTGVEFIIYAAQQLSDPLSTAIPSNILHWATQVVNVLSEYAQTLSQNPEMIRICFPTPPASNSFTNVPQTQSQVLLPPFPPVDQVDAIPTEIPPLEKNVYSWIHYDPGTDSIFTINTSSSTIRLKRQVMKTGLRLRPALAEDLQLDGTKDFWFERAAVSTRTEFLAIMFSVNDYSLVRTTYHIVCWRLINSGSPSWESDWAEVVLTINSSRFEHDSGFIFLAFTKDNSLVTPYGIWDLATKERVDAPVDIYHPPSELHVESLCFSEQGEFVARVIKNSGGNIVLEALNIKGVSLYRQELQFPSSARFKYVDVRLLNLSKTGQKVILRGVGALNEVSVLCQVIADKSSIKIFTSPSSDFRSPEFTKDEDKLVALINAIDHIRTLIGVWALVKDDHGHYLDHANMVYIFKGWDLFIFCLTPPANDNSDTDIITITNRYNGSVYQRPINREWSLDEEEALWSSREGFPSRGIVVKVVQSSILLVFMFYCVR